MKKVTTLIIILVSGLAVLAQQESQYSQYMNNNVLVNPAVTGMEEYLNLTAGYRNQWNGLNGVMNTYYITAHQRLHKSAPQHSLPVRGAKTNSELRPQEVKLSPHGMGGYFYYDDQGISKQSGIGGNYAYHVLLDGFNLSFGASLGVIQYRLDGSLLNPIEGNDPAIPDQSFSAFSPDITVGAWLSTADYYLGLGANQLSQSSINVGEGTSFNKQSNHYFFTGGYKLTLIEDGLDLMPSLLVKYVSPAPVGLDLNMLARIKKHYLIGVSYRWEDAVVAIAEVTFGNYQLGYSYDITTSDLSVYNNGTHEITLSSAFGQRASGGKTLHW